MKKKALLIISILLLLPVSYLFAFQDSYDYLWENEDYATLIANIKNNEDDENILPLLDAFLTGEAKESDKSRIEYHMVRYYMDRGEKEKAIEHFSSLQNHFNAIDERDSDLDRRLAELDMVSADHYIWKGLNKGMESSSLTKDLYRDYPEEFYVALTEAFRLLYTPHIAGGSPKRALHLFEDILEDVDDMNPLDRYSLYSGLAISSFERKEYENSDAYFKKAEETYRSDITMEEYKAKLEKKLR